jgi:hypothetical protein
MRKRAGLLFAAAVLVVGGAGCFSKKSETPAYTPAGSTGEITVPPNAAGANASTGGYDTTVTPELATPTLVGALPDPSALPGFEADEPKESKNPVPLPDGTRDEFTSVDRTYTKAKGTPDEVRVHVSVSDTRSIPVLTAFVSNFSEFSNADGYRKRVTIEDSDAWILYTYDPARTRGGFGGLTMLYRGRFLIQIDGTLGTTEADLAAFAAAFDFSKFR